MLDMLRRLRLFFELSFIHFSNSRRYESHISDKNCSGIKGLPFLDAVEGRVVEGTAPFLWA